MKRRVVLGMALALVLQGCTEGADPLSGHVAPGEMTFVVGQERAIPGTVATLGFFDVPADSRCPSQVQCVWAGDATVTMGLRVGDRGPTYPVTLHTSGAAGPIADTVLGLRIGLVDLSPYPVTPGSIGLDEYLLRVDVRSVN